MTAYLAHTHTCDHCGDLIRCTEPIVVEDTGRHCAEVSPGELVLCRDCREAWSDDDVDDDTDAADDAAWSAR